MKTNCMLAVLTAAFLFAASGPCFALQFGEDLPKAEAAAMGLEFQSIAQGTKQARIIVELKKDGKLGNFQRVELSLKNGDEMLFEGALKDGAYSGKPGCATFVFDINRSHLANAELKVVMDVGKGPGHPVEEFAYHIKLAEHVPAALLSKAVGPATQPALEGEPKTGALDPGQRKLIAMELFINNHKFGNDNGCVSAVPPSGQSTCGHPGHVSEVTWKFLRTDSGGDIYEFTRKYPFDAAAAKTSTKEVTYAGKALTLWEDDTQKIILRPKL